MILSIYLIFALYKSYLKMNKRIWITVCLLAGLLLAGGLFYSPSEKEDEEESVVECRTLTIELQDYAVTRDFTAKIESENPAAIRPQVSGKITKICVNEGAHVKKDQPLFIIDQVPYQAAVKNAEARVVSAKAQLATARQNLEGKEELYRQHVVGDFDLNKARNALAEAEGALAEAEADLTTARNELSYTVVKSPSDGVICMIEYRVGELVGPEMETELTSVSDSRRIHAYTAISEKTLYDLTQYYGCTAEELPEKLPEVTLVTYWDQEMEQKGRVDAISGDVELTTGSIYIRASFDNPQALFRQGSNGVLRVPYHLKDAVLIPQEATYEVQDRYFVYKVVDGVTRFTEIKLFPYNDGKTYAVTDGLKEGDVIVAEGARLLKEGMKVK